MNGAHGKAHDFSLVNRLDVTSSNSRTACSTTAAWLMPSRWASRRRMAKHVVVRQKLVFFFDIPRVYRIPRYVKGRATSSAKPGA